MKEEDEKKVESENKPQHTKQETSKTKEPAAYNTEFMKEEIRQKPVNKKKLLRRTMTTVVLAVVFGAVACVVFLLLEPVINNALNPAEEPTEVSFPEETQEEEMSPEEMIEDDQQIQEAAAEEIAANSVDDITQNVLEEVNRQLEEEASQNVKQEYEEFFAAAKEIASLVQESLVTVTAITPDYDWVGDRFSSTGSVSGVIVADRGTDWLILTNYEILNEADEIRVTFVNDEQAEAALLCVDSITGLALLSVNAQDVEEAAGSDTFTVASLGNSQEDNLIGSLIVAAGSPSGSQGSLNYGIITNAGISLDMTDGMYSLVTTDIYGSTQASGVLADSTGSIIGWIDMSHNGEDTSNLISALGVSELKTLIENMSNEVDMGYLGIHGTDVPESASEEYGIPQGAYVLRTEIDSPCMEAGIQAGDVIISLNGNEITSYAGVVEILEETQAGRYLSVTVMRSDQEGYEEVDLTVQLTRRLTFAE